MNILALLYWIILIISAIFSFWPTAPFYARGLAGLALFVIIGLKIFRIPVA